MTTVAPGYFGSVMSWAGDDMSLVPKRVSQGRRVGERLARRFRTPRGHAIGHPNDGINLGDEVQNVLSSSDVTRLRARINAEALKDPSVATAYVSVTLTTQTKTLAILIRAFGNFGSVDVTFQALPDGTLTVQIQ